MENFLRVPLKGRRNARGRGMYQKTRKLFLSVGEEVIHLRHPEWGVGRVVEEKNSTVAGGISFVKIDFKHVGDKTFDNNIESIYCCYHAGIRRLD